MAKFGKINYFEVWIGSAKVILSGFASISALRTGLNSAGFQKFSNSPEFGNIGLGKEATINIVPDGEADNYGKQEFIVDAYIDVIQPTDANFATLTGYNGERLNVILIDLYLDTAIQGHEITLHFTAKNKGNTKESYTLAGINTGKWANIYTKKTY